MKVVFDTNIILDATLRRDNYRTAQALIMAVAREDMTGIVTANSITDIYYIARKSIGDQKARDVISYILQIFHVAVIDGAVCSKALISQMNDFEDAVVSVCASNLDADYIVSRDKAFAESPYCPVNVLHPDALLEIIDAAIS